MSEVSANVKELGDKLVALTLKDAVELAAYLKNTYGIEPAAAAAAAGPAAAAAVEKTEFTVVLKNAGASKLNVIKVLREATGLGLAEAKALADKTPANIKENIAKADAEKLAEALKAAGAEIELK